MKKLSLFWFCMLITSALIAQNYTFFGAQTIMGNGQFSLDNSPENQGITKSVPYHFFAGVAVTQRWEDKWSFEIGANRLFQNFSFRDDKISGNNLDTNFTCDLDKKVAHFFAGIQRSVELSPANYLYLQTNVGLALVGKTDENKISRFDNLIINNSFKYNGGYFSFMPEIGFEHINTYHNKWSIGFGANITGAKILEGTYDIIDTLGHNLTSHNFSSNGLFFYVRFKFDIALDYKISGKLPWNKPSQVVGNPITTDNPMPDNIDGRQTESMATIYVKSRNITVSIFDDTEEDGDVVSLLFNNSNVLTEHELTTKKHALNLKLAYLYNHLILYSVDYGKTPPCTASLLINDGYNQQQIKFHASTKSCGVITIVYKP